MTHEVKLPKLGMGMTEATVEEWLASAGAAVSEGDDIVVIATDKVDTALQAPAAGALEIVIAAGETVDVGTVIARITP